MDMDTSATGVKSDPVSDVGEMSENISKDGEEKNPTEKSNNAASVQGATSGTSVTLNIQTDLHSSECDISDRFESFSHDDSHETPDRIFKESPCSECSGNSALDSENIATKDKESTEQNMEEVESTDVEKVDLPVSSIEADVEEEGKADIASAGNVTVAASTSNSPDNSQNTYYIKWINFMNKQVPIITQNENGPCPLLAIVNVLLLKGNLKLPTMMEMITSEQLMTYLGDYIIENKPKNLSDMIQANYEQNMQDGMNIMFKLQTGLDVNVKFKGVHNFEYTPECIIFDLLEIPLYHGWLIDPQDVACLEAIGKLSYNQVVEKIITQKTSEDEKEASEALVAEQFLRLSASQLTYHGLCELSHTVKDNELCVFFRNNHFTTLFKHNKELFLLVTDQGFLTETNVVWETLSSVEGDCHFVDNNFRTYTKPVPSTHPIPPPSITIGSTEQIDHDYLVALSLEQEQPMPDSEVAAWGSYEKDSCAIAQHDHEFAKRLQEEEDRRAPTAELPQKAAAPTQPTIPRRNRDREREKDKNDCAIL